MSFDAHKNFAISTVVTPPSPASSGTSLVVFAGEGALFPAVPFNAVVFPIGQLPTAANAEIVRVTAIATDTFMITRIQESTAARSIGVGDQICAAITKKTFDDIQVSPTFTGNVAIGGDTYPSVLLALGLNAHQLTSLHQVGCYSALFGNANARGAGSYTIGFETSIGTTTAAGTCERVVHYAVGAVTAGAGSTIERIVGLTTLDETLGTLGNASIAPFGSTFTGNYFIYYDGTYKSRLAGGDLLVPTELYRTSATSSTRLAGGSSGGGGGHITLFGESHATNASKGQLNASGGWTVTGAFAVATLSASGAVDFASTLTMTGNPATFGVIANGSNGLGLAATHASGAIRFYINEGGSNIEAARVDAGGQFFVAETVGVIVNATIGAAFTGSGNFGSGLELVNTSNTNNASFAVWVANGAKCGEITRVGTTSAVVYTTTSDARHKKYFANFTDALDRVLQIDAGTFQWRRDGQYGSGFLAQQLHQWYPDAVSVPANPEDPWSVDYGKVTPLLVGAIKELAAQVAALKDLRA